MASVVWSPTSAGMLARAGAEGGVERGPGARELLALGAHARCRGAVARAADDVDFGRAALHEVERTLLVGGQGLGRPREHEVGDRAGVAAREASGRGVGADLRGDLGHVQHESLEG